MDDVAREASGVEDMDDVAREASGVEDEVLAEGVAVEEPGRGESPSAFTPEEVRASFKGAIPHSARSSRPPDGRASGWFRSITGS